jgi:hypothetical protein
MRDRLLQLMDRPAIIRTLPDDPAWKPITGIVFEVRDTGVDVMTSSSTMKTVSLARIVDVSLDTRAAQDMILEDPPDDPDYQPGKRALFKAEESQLLRQPPEKTRELAAEAAALFRKVRPRAPRHLWTEQMLERSHFLATGKYDYEHEPGVTGGEVDNFNYRWARERVAKLDADLKARRPEDEIAGHLVRIARHAGRALAKYPDHAELRAWLAKAETIRSKLSDEVRRSNQITEPFHPNEGR